MQECCLVELAQQVEHQHTALALMAASLVEAAEVVAASFSLVNGYSAGQETAVSATESQTQRQQSRFLGQPSRQSSSLGMEALAGRQLEPLDQMELVALVMEVAEALAMLRRTQVVLVGTAHNLAAVEAVAAHLAELEPLALAAQAAMVE